MKNKKRKKILAISSTIAIIISMMSLITFPASAATKVYESESNNTYATADITYNEHQNHGAITSAGDIDWWKITFNTGGMVNIWLGYIPTGCNYDMALWRVDANGVCDSAPCIASVRSSGTQEFMRMRIYPGETVAVRIVSASGYSSSQYMLCFKRYDVGSMRFFDYKDYNIAGYTNDIDSSGCISTVTGYFRSCGYTTSSYSNATATTIYDALPNTSVVFSLGHGANGYIKAGDGTRFSANYYAAWGNTSKNINSYGAGALSEVDLIVYSDCFSGVTDTSIGNLVNASLNKGARCCIGWNNTLTQAVAQDWLEEFSFASSLGQSVKYAIVSADSWIGETYGRNTVGYLELTNHNVGLSPTWSYILG